MKIISIYRELLIILKLATFVIFLIARSTWKASPKHSYIFIVAGCFMLAAISFLMSRNMSEKIKIIRAAIAVLLAFAVILYGVFSSC